MNCDKNCWKDCIELALKIIFVAVFTWGVMNAVCCMKSCNSTSSCTKAQTCSKVSNNPAP